MFVSAGDRKQGLGRAAGVEMSPVNFLVTSYSFLFGCWSPTFPTVDLMSPVAQETQHFVYLMLNHLVGPLLLFGQSPIDEGATGC